MSVFTRPPRPAIEMIAAKSQRKRRERIAVALMSSMVLLDDRTRYPGGPTRAQQAAARAVEYADALIAEIDR